MVYDNSLDNQHRSTGKFARWWFGPYVVTSAKNNAIYHLAELDKTRLMVSVAGKRIKAFKKRHEAEPNPETGDGIVENEESDGDQTNDGSGEDE